jgi:multisubunit Na+/H+ antiporter MnhC subunit
VEFLNFLLIFAAGYLVFQKPDRERLAFTLLVVSTMIMAFVFFVGTRTSVLPPFNY